MMKTPHELLPIPEATDEARAFAVSAYADNTHRAYRSDWADFTSWCAPRQLATLPAEADTVATYLTHLAKRGLKVSTLERRLVTLDQAHRARNHAPPSEAPLVCFVLKGIQRRLGSRPERKAPLLKGDLEALLGALRDGLIGVRDRALLLVGFAGALRRSELVALDVADVALTADGLVVEIRRSKTDPEGHGRTLGIPHANAPELCPVRALRTWLDQAEITTGPLFRPVNKHGQAVTKRLQPRAVARLVKRAAQAAGLDPTRYAGHSLRAGLATAAAMAGASERAIMNQTGHRSTRAVRRYIRDGRLFSDNAAGAVL